MTGTTAEFIRPAAEKDLARLAEIEVFNYRLNFYPFFRSDWFYFDELQVPNVVQHYLDDPALIQRTLVYDDGVVKGFIRINGQEVEKLFVEPVLQGQGIGAKLLNYAISKRDVCWLWALEKNERAIAFYQKHGFELTDTRKPEDDTTEYLVRMQR